MNVRAFCMDDTLDVCRLINSELGYAVTCEDLKMRISQMLEEKDYLIFVAVDDEKIIGFIGLQVGFALEITGKVMRMIALAVACDFQGQGIGSALVEEAEKYAQGNGVSVISVNSSLKREKAHRFYEKHSFYKKGFSFCKQIET